MRPSRGQIPRVPQSAGKGGIGTGGPGATVGSSRLPGATTNGAGLASRQPTSANTSLPKFTPIRKMALTPQAAAAAESPSKTVADLGLQQQQQQAAGLAKDDERSGPVTPEAEGSRPSKIVDAGLGNSDTASSCGSTGPSSSDSGPTTASPLPLANAAGGGVNTGKLGKELNGTLLDAHSRIVPGKSPLTPQAQQLQRKLESLLMETEFGTSQPKTVQAMAAALAAAAAANATESLPPRFSRISPVCAVAGVGTVLLAVLAVSMSWVMWVLVDRQVIGPFADRVGVFHV